MSAQKMPKQKVTFSLVAPEARSVQLAGDFTDWQESPLDLKKQKDGVWKTTISLEPGEHAYRMLVDGQWQDDPSCMLRQPNGFGSQNCICIVNGNGA